ncbi:hypothetical protein C2S51_029842 [Perilla frutescens var. frutescens]|nr:hypothetical protein C2S51_029842 [Perilla frutescens var. frutescens]
MAIRERVALRHYAELADMVQNAINVENRLKKWSDTTLTKYSTRDFDWSVITRMLESGLEMVASYISDICNGGDENVEDVADPEELVEEDSNMGKTTTDESVSQNFGAEAIPRKSVPVIVDEPVSEVTFLEVPNLELTTVDNSVRAETILEGSQFCSFPLKHEEESVQEQVVDEPLEKEIK